MCGRYNLRTNLKALEFAFGLFASPELPARFNVSPSQDVPVVRAGESLSMLKWGLIPSWAKDPKIGYSLINARGETVAEKPSFRSAFKKRRCLIPATGFYEWAKAGTKKIPHHFHLNDGSLFAFAGLWESWLAPDGEEVETCTIITTSANELVAPYHDRMPVILPNSAFAQWLDPAASVEQLKELLVPYDAGQMTEEEVSTLVNSPKNEGPELLNSL